MKKHFLLSLAIICSTIISLAASSSLPENVPSTGRDFWLTFMHNNDVNNDYLKLRVYAVAQSATTITIEKADGSVLTSNSVSAGSVFSYTIPDTERDNVYMTTSGQVESKGLHVTSDAADIALYFANDFNNGSKISFDATPVLSTPSLGKEYVVQTYYADKTAEEMAIVGTEDGTTVTIVLGHAAINDLGTTFSSGQTINISLNAGQTYQLKGNVDGEGLSYLSGTTVLSTKPVAVFNGGINTTVTYDDGADGDHIVEQSIPISAWGKRFIVSAMHGFPDDANVSSSEPTQYSVTAIYDGTIVKVNGVTLCTLNKGETNYEYDGKGITVDYDDEPKFIETSMPVICYGYTTNGTANKIKVGILNRNVGEPSMVLIPDKRQGVKTSLFTTYNDGFSGEGIAHYANVFVPTDAVSYMKLNGADISSSFSALSNHFDGESTSWSYARVLLASGYNILSNTANQFLAYTYGIQVGSARGYAMATNFNLAPAAPEVFIGGERMSHNDMIDFCNRHPGMDFSANVDYVHDSIRWDYGDGNTSTAINDNHVYNILVNGQSQTNIVKFFVFRHDPLSGDKHTDTVKVTLNVHPTYYDTLEVDICGAEESYHWTQSSDNFNNEGISKTFLPGNDALGVSATGHEYHFDKNTEIEYFDSIVYRTENWNCDSIFYLRLRVHSEYTDTVNDAVCGGEAYAWAGHPASGIHHLYVSGSAITTIPTGTAGLVIVTDSMINQQGCDSIEVLRLTVHPKPVVNLVVPAPICEENDPLLTIGYTSSDADTLFYTMRNSSSAVVRHDTITPVSASGSLNIAVGDLPDGAYTVTALATSENICSSVESEVSVTINNKPSVTLSAIGGQCYPASAFTVTYAPTDAASLTYTVLQGSTVKQAATTIPVPASAPYTFDIDVDGYAAGTYLVTAFVTSAEGCDSDEDTKQFEIFSKPTISISESAISACEGENITITVSASSSATRVDCEVRNSSDAIVAGETIIALSFNNHPVQLSTEALPAGSYTIHVVAKNEESGHSCPSEEAVIPFVNHPKYLFEAKDTICDTYTQNRVYRWRDIDRPYRLTTSAEVAGYDTVYYDSLKTEAGGCDSVYAMRLHINRVVPSVIEKMICQGESYDWIITNPCNPSKKDTLARNLNSDFTHSDTIRCAGASCNSVFQLNLSVATVEIRDTAAIFCAGGSFHWDRKPAGINYSAADVYSDTIKSHLGCDSVITRLTLTEKPVVQYFDTIHRCYGETFDWTPVSTTHSYSVSDDYSETVSSLVSPYCDSIIYNLHLVIDATQPHGHQNEIVCGSSFIWNGFTYTATGDYDIHLTSSGGCDSLATLHLTLSNDGPFYPEAETIIETQLPYTWPRSGITYNAVGTYTYNDNHLNRFGCDSNYVYTLIVSQKPTRSENRSVCEGKSLVWRGKEYKDSVSGAYTFETTDSIFILNLTKNPSYNFRDTLHVCYGVEYTWRGTEYTNTNNEVKTRNYFTSCCDCDSNFRAVIYVQPVYTGANAIDAEMTLCEGEVFSWGSDPVFYEASLTPGKYNYTSTFKTLVQPGCDSTVNLTLNVVGVTTINTPENITICQDELPYVWSVNGGHHTRTIYSAGVYGDTIPSLVSGCDSVRSLLNLTVNLSYQFPHENIEVSPSLVPYLWHGQSLSTNGFKVATFKTVNDCDSTYTASFYIGAYKRDTLPITSCDSYTWQRTGQSYTVSGTYTDTTHHTISGEQVDSIHTLALTIRYTATETVSEESCESYTWSATGETYTTSGVHTHTFPGGAGNGCDSIVTLNLTIYNNVVATPESPVTICSNELPYMWHGKNRGESGTYYDTLSTGHGCDSICSFTLTVLNYTEPDTIVTMTCDLASYEWVVGGNTIMTIPAHAVGDYWYNVPYTPAGECETRHVLHQTVYSADPDTTKKTICHGESFDWVIRHPCPSDPTDTLLTLAKNITASCKLFDTLHCDGLSCDPVYYLDLTVREQGAVVVDAPYRLCPNEKYEWRGGLVIDKAGIYEAQDESDLDANGCPRTHRITVTELQPVYISATDDICYGEPYTFVDSTYKNLDAGLHILRDTLLSADGCDSVYMTLNLTVGQDYSVEESEVACDSYLWHGRTLTKSGTYYDSLASVGGCDSVYTLHLTVNKSYSFTETYDLALSELPFTVHQFTYDYSAAGTYSDTRTYQTVAGCDSVYHLTFNIYNAPVIEKRDTTDHAICRGGTYLWREGTYTEAGQYSLVTGDSIHLLRLKVNDVYSDTLYINSCGSYKWAVNGQTYYVSGTYTEPRTSHAGCDSVLVLKLTVSAPSPVTNINASVCKGELFAWGGESFIATASRILRDTLVNAAGCDSVIVMSLTVNDYAVGTTTNAAICDGDAYLWASNGKSYTAPNTYYDTIAGGGVCGTINILNLTVNSSYEIFDDIEVREEVMPYKWRAHTLEFDGSHYEMDVYDNYTTVSDCDSVYHLHLHIVPTPPDQHDFAFRDTLVKSACESYVWTEGNGNTYSASGFYSDTLWKGTPQRYDTIHFLDLTISNNYVFFEDEIVSCDNEFITWHCKNYNPSAGYYAVKDTVDAANGCDSIFNTTFLVYKSYRDTLLDTICRSDIYSWRGMLLSPAAAGNYYYADTLTSLVTGCDSIFNLRLTVTPRTEPTIDDYTMCNLASYDWEGYHIANKSAGDYEYYKYYTPSGECETYRLLRLHVYDITPDTTRAAVCYGEPYDWWIDTDANGTLDRHVQGGIFVSGYQYDTISDGTCDKVFVLELTVGDAPEYKVTEEAVFCPEGSYTWRGKTYTEEGVYYDTVPSLVTGCDSIIFTLDLSARTPIIYNETVHRCYGETYTWAVNGATYAASATDSYAVPFFTAPTCDSVVYNLTVVIDAAPLSGEESVIICDDSYLWRGKMLTESGDYVDTITTALGCDSICTLHLTLSEDFEHQETVVITADKLPYTWHEDTYTSAGEFTQHHQNIFGCDSDYVLHLIISPKPYREENRQICDGEVCSWRDNNYTIQDSYSVETADSIFILNLTVGKVYHFAESMTVCSDALPLLWHGQSLTSGGTYTDPRTTALGCDSIYTLTLSVYDATVVHAEGITLCAGEPFNWGRYFVPAPINGTVYRDTFPSLTTGCDSVVDMTVNVISPTTINTLETVIICENELPYLWRGHSIAEAGFYGDTIPSEVSGCDSILSSLRLRVHKRFYEYHDVEVGEDDVPYRWNGHHNDTILYEEGTCFDSLKSAITGCDSIYELHLHINFYQRDTTWADGTHGTEMQCDSYIWTVNGHTYTLTESGLYTDTLKSVEPVRIDYLSLGIKHGVVGPSETATACGSYLWNGIPYDATGVYNKIYAGGAANGCDSVVTLNLTIYPEYQFTDPEIVICANEYVHWEDTVLHTAGTYTRTYSSVHGCDSTRSVTVVVKPIYEIQEKDTLCEGESLTWRGLNISGVEPSNTPYTYYDRLVSGEGCDSVYVLSLLMQRPIVFRDTVVATLCEGEHYPWYGNNGVFVKEIVAGDTPKDYAQFGDGVCVDSLYVLQMTINPIRHNTISAAVCYGDIYTWDVNGKDYDATGSYADTLTNPITGCDSILILNLYVAPEPQLQTETISLCPGESVTRNGIVYSADDEGLHLDTIRSHVNTLCDSIIMAITIEKRPVNVYNEEIYLEDGESVMRGASTIGTPGLYVVPLPNEFCNDTLNILAHVLLHKFDTVNVHVCAGVPVTGTLWDNTYSVIPTAAGVEVLDTIMTALTVKDTVWHRLVVNEGVVSVDSTAFVRQDTPFLTWEGHSPFAAESNPTPLYFLPTSEVGVETYTATSASCDTLYRLHLHVINPDTVIYDNVCPSDLPKTYSAEGHSTLVAPATITPGIDTVLVDSVLRTFGGTQFRVHDTIRLHVGREYVIDLPDMAVQQGAPLLIGDYSVNTDTADVRVETVHLISSEGCDSVIAFGIKVVKYVEREETICQGDTYSWLGFDFTMDIDTTFLTPDAAAISETTDSVCHLVLHVEQPVVHSEQQFRNATQVPYTWSYADRSKQLDTTGVYTDTIYSDTGCASDIYVMNFFVGELVIVDDTVCEGSIVDWYGTQCTAPSMNNNVAYNDTIFRLNLYAAPLYSFLLDTTIYIGPGRATQFDWLNEDGAVISSFPTADPTNDKRYGTWEVIDHTANYGCDSVYHLTLRIYGDTLIEQRDTICADQVLSWHCKYFDGADLMGLDTILYDSLKTWYGADSLYVLYLHVGDSCMPKPAVPLDTAVCIQNVPYNWYVNDELVSQYDIPGIYTFIDDSIYTLVLTIIDDYSNIFEGYDTIVSGEPYTWHGIDYPNLFEGDTLLMIEDVTSRGGCDSIHSLWLHVKPLYVVYIDSIAYDTICYGESYEWVVHGSVVSPDGWQPSITESKTLTTQYYVQNVSPVADTIYHYTMNLVVRDLQIIPEYVEIPDGGIYVWSGHLGDITLQNDTIVSDTLRYTTFGECDSVIYTLTLTHLPPATNVDLYAVYCRSEISELWESVPFPINELGDFTRQIITTNHLGGDSIITLHYSVVDHYAIEDDTILSPLDGDVYDWHGFEYHAHQDTSFVWNGTSSAGCDSVVTRRVLTGLLASDTVNVQVCYDEDSYHFVRGTLDTTFTPLSTGYYYGIKPTFLEGFDSVIVVSVKKMRADTLHKYDTICYDPYLAQSPIDTIYMPFATLGCDSLVEVTHHFIAPSYTGMQTVVSFDTVPQGSRLIWGHYDIPNIQPLTPQQYVDSFKNEQFLSQYGCDSIVNLYLTVAPTYEFRDTVKMCLGDAYTWDMTGETYTPQTQGFTTYDLKYRTVLGFDSVYYLVLNTQVPYAHIEEQVIEPSETYNWRGRDLDTTGYYYDSLLTVHGCDSVYGLYLWVGFVSSDTTKAAICANETYTWGDREVDIEGLHYRAQHYPELQPPVDSIYVLDLTVNPIYSFVAELTVAQDSLFVWDVSGKTIATDVAGIVPLVYQDTTNFGCDSIYNLTLNVEPTYFVQIYDTICQVGDMNYVTFDSVRTEYLLTVAGFDSIVEYHLFIHGTPVIHEYDTVCHSGDDVYLWHDMNLAAMSPEGGDTVLYAMAPFRPGVFDCDTLFTLNLHVHPDYLFVFRDTIPDSRVYGTHWADTLNVPEIDTIIPQLPSSALPYIFYDTLTSSHGCDSVYSLELFVGPTYIFHDTLTACNNAPFTWLDTTYQFEPTGLYRDTILLFEDSLGVQSDTVRLWQDTIVMFYDTMHYQTVLGYDSVYTLTLTINSMKISITTDTICPSDSIINGERYVQIPGIYCDTTVAQDGTGCDSICYLLLYNYEQYDTTFIDTICYDTPYMWEDSIYQYADSGLYNDIRTYQTIHGCDSVLHLQLYVENLYQPAYTDEICISDTLHWWHRDTIDVFLQEGDSLTKNTYPRDSVGRFMFVDTVYSALGCAYYDTLFLNVVHPPVVLEANAEMFCADDMQMAVSYTVDSLYGEPSEYSIFFSESAKYEGFKDTMNVPMVNTGTILVETMFDRTYFPRPDTYEATLYLSNGSCRDTSSMTSVTFEFDVLYPSWFAEQHWNDLLAVLAPSANGGYEFTAYQWYFNGSPIEGATSSMLYYLHDIPILPTSHDTIAGYYQVMLTREDDGKSILTCPIDIVSVKDDDVHTDWYFTVDHTFINRENPSLNILTNTTGSYYLYDASGKLLTDGKVEGTETHNAFEITNINEYLYVQGTYLLWMISDTKSPYTGKIVKQAVKLLVY